MRIELSAKRAAAIVMSIIMAIVFMPLAGQGVAHAAYSDVPIKKVIYKPKAKISFAEGYEADWRDGNEYQTNEETGAETTIWHMPKQYFPNSKLCQENDEIEIQFADGVTKTFKATGYWYDEDEDGKSEFHFSNWVNKSKTSETLAEYLSEAYDELWWIEGADFAIDCTSDEWSIGKNNVTADGKINGGEVSTEGNWFELASFPVEIEFTVTENPVESIEYKTSKQWKLEWYHDDYDETYDEDHQYGEFPYDGDVLIVNFKDGSKREYKVESWSDEGDWGDAGCEYVNVKNKNDRIGFVDHDVVTNRNSSVYAIVDGNYYNNAIFMTSKLAGVDSSSPVVVMYAGKIATPKVDKNLARNEAYKAAVKKAQTAKVTAFKAKSQKKKKAKITWKAVKGVSGYQIQYSTNKKFKKAKSLTIKKQATNKATLKKLKVKKKYFIKIRPYTNVKNTNGKTQKVYGKWSATKKIKARK